MSKIFESIQVSEDVKRFVDHSFNIVNKIHAILEKQAKTQRDLAILLGKSESEISKWMQGTHNFTLKSISKIESVLKVNLFEVLKEDEVVVKTKVALFYTTFFKQEDIAFKKSDLLNQPKFDHMPSSLKATLIGDGKLKQKLEVNAGESNYALGA